MSNYKATVFTSTNITHEPGLVGLTDGYNHPDVDNVITLVLDQFDELPIAASLALELLEAAGECEISDEPSTRAAARVALLELQRQVILLVDTLDEADADAPLLCAHCRSSIHKVGECWVHVVGNATSCFQAQANVGLGDDAARREYGNSVAVPA